MRVFHFGINVVLCSIVSVMTLNKKLIKIAIVEDDPYYNLAMYRYVSTLCNPMSYPELNFSIQRFEDPVTCIENLDKDIDILLLDYLLINKEGDEVFTAFDVIKEVNISLDRSKLILISAQQSAITTVRLMNTGIYDYVDKSMNSKNRVGAIIQNILAHA